MASLSMKDSFLQPLPEFLPLFTPITDLTA
jgi:hypothetical protein